MKHLYQLIICNFKKIFSYKNEDSLEKSLDRLIFLNREMARNEMEYFKIRKHPQNHDLIGKKTQI